MRFAYADPPYIGQAKKLYGCAEIDHKELIETMPLKKLQALEKYTESNLRKIQKELNHRKTISISELALVSQER